MRYSLEPKYRKYVQGYGFLPFTRKSGDKYGKKLLNAVRKTGINAATKTGINAAKNFEINIVRILMDTAKKKKKTGLDCCKNCF